MLAPLSTATSIWSRTALALDPRLQARAVASAPAGSMIVRVSSKMSLIAAQTSSLVTRTTLVHGLTGNRERQLTDLAHGDTVGEEPDVIEVDARALPQRPVHARRPRTARRRSPSRPAAAP